jgi:hypothetical protein
MGQPGWDRGVDVPRGARTSWVDEEARGGAAPCGDTAYPVVMRWVLFAHVPSLECASRACLEQVLEPSVAGCQREPADPPWLAR